MAESKIIEFDIEQQPCCLLALLEQAFCILCPAKEWNTGNCGDISCYECRYSSFEYMKEYRRKNRSSVRGKDGQAKTRQQDSP